MRFEAESLVPAAQPRPCAQPSRVVTASLPLWTTIAPLGMSIFAMTSAQKLHALIGELRPGQSAWVDAKAIGPLVPMATKETKVAESASFCRPQPASSLSASVHPPCTSS
jgi:hypothetical protein